MLCNRDPARPRMTEGEVPAEATAGANGFGRPGYLGPAPPPGDDPHCHVSWLLAVDEPVRLTGCPAIRTSRPPSPGSPGAGTADRDVSAVTQRSARHRCAGWMNRGARGSTRPRSARQSCSRHSGGSTTPATRNRQGFDFGSQYRSAIFCHDADQMEAAIASRDAEQQSLRRQIVTQITLASAFYRAEEYHQRYLEKHGHASCAATIQ